MELYCIQHYSYSSHQVALASQCVGKASGTGKGPAVATADRDPDAGSSSPSDLKSRSKEDGSCPNCRGKGKGWPERDLRATAGTADCGDCEECRSSSRGSNQHVRAGVEGKSGTGAVGYGDRGGDGDVLRVTPGMKRYFCRKHSTKFGQFLFVFRVATRLPGHSIQNIVPVQYLVMSRRVCYWENCNIPGKYYTRS